MKQAGKSQRVIPSVAELNRCGREVHYSIAKARSLLGYKPEIDLNSGLDVSARWFIDEALISQDRISEQTLELPYEGEQTGNERAV